MISNFYRSNFDSYKYLNKIYNLIIELGDIKIKKYIEKITARKDSSIWHDIDFYGICEYFNFSMREINKLLNDFELLDEYMNTSYGGTFSEDSIVKYLFLSYCLGLKIVDRIGLSEFLEGKGCSFLKKIVFTNEELTKILKRCYEL